MISFEDEQKEGDRRLKVAKIKEARDAKQRAMAEAEAAATNAAAAP